MMLPASAFTILYGPVPTGQPFCRSKKAKVRGFWSFQMCLGTVTKRAPWPVARKSATQRGPGLLSLSLNVSLSTIVSEATHSLMALDMTMSGAARRRMPKVNTTSSAVKGWPSLHVTPSRSLTVISVKSLLYS